MDLTEADKVSVVWIVAISLVGWLIVILVILFRIFGPAILEARANNRFWRDH